MRVAELWRYPFKSMAGECLQRVDIGPKGVPGDRAYALRQGDNTRNAKKFPGLMAMKAWYERSPRASGDVAPMIELEDGRRFSADDPAAARAISEIVSDDFADAAARAISEIVGDEVAISALAPEADLDFYRRHERRTLEESRAIFGLEEGEPFPDVSAMPQRVIEFATPPGTFFDCYPLLVMTRASLDALQAAAGDAVIDVRRFRPNILIETPEEGFVEQGWIGRRLAIGDVELSIEVACPRCVMTTIGFHDLPRDTSIMRTLVRECRHELGVYAEVIKGGAIRTGDEARLLG